MNWNYSSNQKIFTTKVVRLTIKVNLVEKNFDQFAMAKPELPLPRNLICEAAAQALYT